MIRFCVPLITIACGLGLVSMGYKLKKPTVTLVGDFVGLLPNVTFLEKDASKNGKMFA